MDYNRQMLNKIRGVVNEQKSSEIPNSEVIVEKDNLNNRMKVLMEEYEANCGQTLNEEVDQNQNNKAFIIKNNDVQFGSVRASQEDAIRKTVGDVKLKDDALRYYPELQDLVLDGEIVGLGVTFQFRYKDPSGDGVYTWAKGLQLTDSNTKTLNKVRDAFLNWKQSLVDDGDLLEKLHKEALKEK